MSDRPEHQVGSTEVAGRTVDDGQGRKFPCEKCGADLEFHIGQQSLSCPFCHHVKQIELSDGAAVEEQDLKAVLQRVRQQRSSRSAAEGEKETDGGTREIRCDACGATVVFEGTLTSSACAYCDSPIQLENAHTAADDRVPVDGVVPFQVNEGSAGEKLSSWVSSRWFAPNDFKQKGGRGKFAGVYLPYWTYDAMTFSRYRGERGEHYYVTETTTDSEGNEQTEQVQRTHWYPVSGRVQRFFDDVLVCATTGLPRKIVRKLEPWELNQCLPFTRQALAGFQARTYEIELDTGFDEAKERMEATIEVDVRYDIGGDAQRISRIQTRYDALTFKHLLLPLWLLSYRYREKVYQVMVNAQTGEVQGERPWSWIKITLAVVAVAAVVGVVAFLVQ